MKKYSDVEWWLTVVACFIAGWCCHVFWVIDCEAPNLEYKYKTEVFRVTAYCPCEKCCGRFADGITASGHVIKVGDRFVAASKDMKFGTMVTIPGYNDNQPVKVFDRGGAIKGNKLDVYFDTHQEALNWGVKILEVKL